MNNKRILIVCRDFASVKSLDKISPVDGSYYILASDDLRVQEKAKDYSWIRKVCWLEKAESFYAVSADVIKLLDEINLLLASLACSKIGFQKDLLYWISHCEGGLTTQRIQDALLLISSYLSLIQEYKIEEILLISKYGLKWEDEVLIQTAKSKKLKISFSFSYFFYATALSFKQSFENLGRVIYYLFNFFRIKLSESPHEARYSFTNSILFPISSSAKKHVSEIIPVMKALESEGCFPVAICWRLKEPFVSNDCVRQIRAENLLAEGLEPYASLGSLFKAIFKTIVTWFKALKKRREFLANIKLRYKNVNLQNLLWPSIRFFILTKVWLRFLFKNAVREFLDDLEPVAVKPWGADIFAEGNLLLAELRQKENPALAFWWQRHSIEYPYHNGKNSLDLYLAANSWQKRNYEKIGVPTSKIELSASSLLDNIGVFIKSTTQETSMNLLGIPSHFSKYFLYDSGSILRGHLSTMEQVSTLDALLKFAQVHPDVALLIKPHSSHKAGILEHMLNLFKFCKNIFLLSKDSEFAYHALNVADLLITKYSTLGFEAMIFKKPVISIILDKEDRFKVYGTAADYFDNIGEMTELLVKILQDEKCFEEWKTSHNLRRIKFVDSFLSNAEGNKLSPSEVIASKISFYVSSRRSNHLRETCHPQKR